MRLAFSGTLAERLINEDVLHHHRFLISPLISFTATLHHNFGAKYSVVSFIWRDNGLQRVST